METRFWWRAFPNTLWSAIYRSSATWGSLVSSLSRTKRTVCTVTKRNTSSIPSIPREHLSRMTWNSPNYPTTSCVFGWPPTIQWWNPVLKSSMACPSSIYSLENRSFSSTKPRSKTTRPHLMNWNARFPCTIRAKWSFSTIWPKSQRTRKRL